MNCSQYSKFLYRTELGMLDLFSNFEYSTQANLLKGASYSGSTGVSKTSCVGSIPTAPAKEKWPEGPFFFI